MTYFWVNIDYRHVLFSKIWVLKYSILKVLAAYRDLFNLLASVPFRKDKTLLMHISSLLVDNA